MHFSDIIINWYFKNKRDLPWRETVDPYKIWVSEIILQQTRVDQGVLYYHRFINTFPNVRSLAQSNIDEVLKVWEGLGYYSRARNMHYAATQIIEEFNGVFPGYYDQLLKLKGIGDYTAAAIASIAFREAVPVVDGNVYRVLSRYLGIDTDIGSHKAKLQFKEAAGELMDERRPDLFNQALMEYGALQCKINSPDCGVCAMKDSCVAFNQDLVKKLPVKNKKVKVKKRYFYYFIVHTAEGEVFINKRNGNDIWKNLYDFPLIETKHHAEFEQVISEFSDQFQLNQLEITGISKEIKHLLTHQRLLTRFIHLKITNTKKLKEKYIETPISTISELAFPSLITRYLNDKVL